MRALVVGLLLAFGAAACTSEAEVIEVAFSCINSADVTVRFFPGGSAYSQLTELSLYL